VRPYLLIAVLIPCVLYLTGLGEPPLQLPDEPREAEVARELWVLGPLHVPRLNGEFHMVKPPLTYWVTGLFFDLAGERVPPEWAVRLSSAAFTLASTLVVFLLGRAWKSNHHGALAALIFAVSPGVLSHGRRLVTDPALAFFVTVAVGCGIHALRAASGRRVAALVLASGMALGLGFLSKGPVAVVLTGLALGGAIVAGWGPRALVGRRTVALAATSAAVLAPAVGLWLWILWRDGGEALVQQYVAYHTGGFSGASRTHVSPWWFYLVHLPDGFLPWLLLLPVAALAGHRDERDGGVPRRALLAWVLVPLAFLSIMAQKREVYALPLYPPLALLAASAILDFEIRGLTYRFVRPAWLLFGWLASLGAIALPLTGGVYAALGGEQGLALLGVLLALSAVAVCFAWRRPEIEDGPLGYPCRTTALVGIVTLALVLFVQPAFRAERTLRPMGRAFATALEGEPQAKLYGYRLGETMSGALAYELGRTFPTIDGPEALRAALADPACRVVGHEGDLDAAGHTGHSVGRFTGAKRTLVLISP
jgi:4-amino-4-deoxy-L-arabinose transferase